MYTIGDGLLVFARARIEESYLESPSPNVMHILSF